MQLPWWDFRTGRTQPGQAQVFAIDLESVGSPDLFGQAQDQVIIALFDLAALLAAKVAVQVTGVAKRVMDLVDRGVEAVY